MKDKLTLWQFFFGDSARAFGSASIILLVLLAIAPAKNYFSQWRHYQKLYLRLIRGRADAVTLERGVTHDPEFELWANKVWSLGNTAGSEVSLKDFRKDVILEIYNEAGQVAIAYKIYRCWVSEYQVVPELDSNANAVAIQHIKLENEGWERDTSVTEPTEPSFTTP